MKSNHRCDHIGLYTNHSKKLVDFYTKKLAFKKIKEEKLERSIFEQIFGIAVDCHFIRLMSDSVMLEIFQPIARRARECIRNNVGINHWGYCVDNRELFVRRLRKQRVPVIEIKRKDHLVYFVADPDGNRIEIRECNKHKSFRQRGGC